MIKIFSSVRSTYRAASVAIDSGYTSNAMRRSFELVQMCHRDLQLLIKLRHEHLHLLEDQTLSLERLNAVIEKVHGDMVDAYRIVEKYRPELHSGKTSLQHRIAWASHDSQELQRLGPIISQHHAAVLAEITILRSLTIISATQNDAGEAKESISSQKQKIFDNTDLLEDLMGDANASPNLLPTTPLTEVATRASIPNLLTDQVYCDLPEPVIPNLIPHQQPLSIHQPTEQRSSIWMSSAETSLESHLRNQRVVLNQSDHSGLSLLFEGVSDPSLNQILKTLSQPSCSSSSDQMRQLSLPSSSFSLIGDDFVPSPHFQYSLVSNPSTQSLGSRETLSHQISEMQRNTISDHPVNYSHLHSLQPTPSSKATALASISRAPLASESSQNNPPNQHSMPFVEQYQCADNTTKDDDPQSSPRIEMANNKLYELQGSERSR
ncbi:hypothetical protein LI328DRAFT_171950 [Trichoderma asperelloides]|nr:hypothetical protein LI328DRAFT_171950 [Trichoderma asperelloides]